MGVKATRVVAIPRSVISPSPPGSAGNWAIRRDTTQQPNLWTAASLKKPKVVSSVLGRGERYFQLALPSLFFLPSSFKCETAVS